MAIARGLAATAVFACLATGTASPAWADTPTMNGNYTETSTTPSGRTIDNSWAVNSCGNGCLWIKAGLGASQATLVDGQWVMDTMSNVNCVGGGYTLYGTTTHTVWDPNTLTGTATHTYITGACGRPPGDTQVDQISIKASS
ncbi:hypothetical protein [Mycobacterium shigaense]|uniref:Uncharacterized protein n=1 Tax=Mycobacterium shigaense TaxID=722731 RepID=A0A1Z4EGN2_9MYCO|nr:hypothetical protein [Mycobacterium shigaense]MEA1122830.1 hypothetical protein [Mycobacterium shigaense]PRI13233.1 hypothetical protein B2J96_20775 [Mycobacterium shigaense]BAX92119.1 hypothetical protein MSG_01970 [Mycobacterium shigaense]